MKVLPDDSEQWRMLANCRGLNPELFFPARGEKLDAPKAVCSACIVRAQCLEHALQTHQKFGIWGGESERERRRTRRRRREVETRSA